MAHRFDMVRGSVMTKGRPRLSDINGLVGITIGLLRPRFLRFLLVGALNTAFGYAIFLLSLKLGMSVGAALSASTLAGVVFNFQTSRRLVFRSAETGLLLRFVGVYAMVLVTNYVAVVGLKQLAFHDWSAQALMLIPMAAMSFVAQRNLVFGYRMSS